MVTTQVRHPVRRRTVVRPTAPVEDVEAPEDVTPPEDVDPVDNDAAGPGWRGRLVAWTLLAALAAVLVAGGLLGRHWYDQRQLADARSQALAAARQACVNFVSISASTVDADLKRIADGATGQFKDEFTRDTAQVKAAVVQNKVESRGTVLRAGTVSADRRSAVVLVAVDATVKNTNAPDGRLSHYRIQVNMARDNASGRWLVSQLQFVG
jgi:Mce-associated membrane protein